MSQWRSGWWQGWRHAAVAEAEADKGGVTDPGGLGGGGKLKGPIVLADDQVRTALVSMASAPQGWVGSAARFQDAADALRACQAQTETNCGGFVTLGKSYLAQTEHKPEDRVGKVAFSIYSFRSPDDAKAAMKGIPANMRGKAGAEAKPLEVKAGADETDAFTGRHTEIFMRVGGALVRVESEDLREGQPYADFAKLQIDRIKKTAEGKNPDA
ncbi:MULTISPECIES: hypothetical protein [unclassified Streptomyces]|uniref:hypothetical protein n=1 Tax=unclassified Streptomyces TaxID=2593676 RepID=UPI00342F2CCF